jgi:hypothetical protein
MIKNFENFVNKLNESFEVLQITDTNIFFTGLSVKKSFNDEQYLEGYFGTLKNKFKIDFNSFATFASNPIITQKKFLNFESLSKQQKEYFEETLTEFLKKSKYSKYLSDNFEDELKYNQIDFEFILTYYNAYYLEGNLKSLEKFNNIGSDWQTKFKNFETFETEYDRLLKTYKIDTNDKTFKTAINLVVKSGNVSDGIKYLKTKKYKFI